MKEVTLISIDNLKHYNDKLQEQLSDKVNKVEGKGLSSNDFTDELKQKVNQFNVSEYVTKQEFDDLELNAIKNTPILEDESALLNIVDDSGNVGLLLNNQGLYVKDVITENHTLSNKANKSDIPLKLSDLVNDTGYITITDVPDVDLSNYVTDQELSDKGFLTEHQDISHLATKDEISDLVDMSAVEELQDKVEILIGSNLDMSVRDIAVDVLTETLVSDSASEAYDTLAEMSAWIKSHPEDASAMNTAIQKNAEDIANVTTNYKASDTRALTAAKEYIDDSINALSFYTLDGNPMVEGEPGTITFVDENGNIGLKFSNDVIIAKDVVTPDHVLSEKADKNFVTGNYYTKVEVEKRLVDAVTGGQVVLEEFATEQWVNEQGFLKAHQDISHLAKKSELPKSVSELENDKGYITLNEVPVLEIPDEYITETELSKKGYLTEHQDISSKQDIISDLNTIREGAALGKTALQEVPEGYAKMTDIPEVPSLDGYATEQWVSNKNYAEKSDLENWSFDDINDNPIINDVSGELNIIDNSGNVGFKINEDGLFVKDVITDNHILSQKADLSYVDAKIAELRRLIEQIANGN